MILGIGIVILYLVIGFGLAKRDLPAAWDRAREQVPYSEYHESFVKRAMLSMFLFWPIKVPAKLISQRLHRAVVEADPEEQKRYIKKLERELGIGE